MMVKHRGLLALVCAAAAGIVAAGPPEELIADPQFNEVAISLGLFFETQYGTAFTSIDASSQLMQRNLGNGVAVGDYDNDGDLDIYLLTQLGYTNRLFRNDLNLGSPLFTDVTALAGVGCDGFSRAAAFVDLDNDGLKDLVVLNDQDGTGHPPSRIYRNNGDGTFDDRTAGSDFPALGLIRGGMAVADYDRDGLLDIYVSNWGREVGGGNPVLPGNNILFRNLGNFRFENVNFDTHLGTLARDSFSAIFHDLDGDHEPDLFVAIDHTSDVFYQNIGTLIFADYSAIVGLTHTGNDMGVVCGDIDDDLDLDLYATNITDPDMLFGTTQFNALHVNQFDSTGTFSFVDEAAARNVEDTYWGWGVKFTDVENDGDLDIVVVTGFDEFVFIAGIPGTPLLDSPMVLFINDGSGNFTRDTGAGIGGSDDSRGLAAFDYDRDGDEDLLVTNIDERARLLENVSTQPGNWLRVRLVQSPGNNRDGIGASVFYTVGTKTRRREMIVSDSYLTGSPTEIHIGLGAATLVDELVVHWTDGTESTFNNLAVNQGILLSQASPDADLDGIVDMADCAPDDGTTWALPGAVDDLRLGKSAGMAQLTWSRPLSGGGLNLVYDLLRSDAPQSASSSCLLASLTGRSATDAAPPSPTLFYLVRTVNGCGDTLGPDSSGQPRSAPACP